MDFQRYFEDLGNIFLESFKYYLYNICLRKKWGLKMSDDELDIEDLDLEDEQ